MKHIKAYIGEQFIGKKYHFKCDCIIPIDVIATVTDYDVSGNEIILTVNTDNNKLLHIGLNAPSLHIQEFS